MEILYRYSLFYFFFQCVFDIGIQRKTCLAGKHGDLAMDSGGQPDIQHSLCKSLYSVNEILQTCILHVYQEKGNLLRLPFFEP